MKYKRSTLAILVSGLAIVTGRAQGIVEFTNIGQGVNAPVSNLVAQTWVDGADGYVAQLYGGSAGMSEGSLVPISPMTEFGSGAAAGYFFYGDATNSMVTPGQVGTFQVRVFSDAFASYEAAFAAAQNNPSVLVGKSSVFENATGFNGSPADLVNLTRFDIAPVPEPQCLALVALGAAAYLFRRRR
jgi:hypothetical protein